MPFLSIPSAALELTLSRDYYKTQRRSRIAFLIWVFKQLGYRYYAHNLLVNRLAPDIITQFLGHNRLTLLSPKWWQKTRTKFSNCLKGGVEDWHLTGCLQDRILKVYMINRGFRKKIRNEILDTHNKMMYRIQHLYDWWSAQTKQKQKRFKKSMEYEEYVRQQIHIQKQFQKRTYWTFICSGCDKVVEYSGNRVCNECFENQWPPLIY